MVSELSKEAHLAENTNLNCLITVVMFVFL